MMYHKCVIIYLIPVFLEHIFPHIFSCFSSSIFFFSPFFTYFYLFFLKTIFCYFLLVFHQAYFFSCFSHIFHLFFLKHIFFSPDFQKNPFFPQTYFFHIFLPVFPQAYFFPHIFTCFSSRIFFSTYFYLFFLKHIFSHIFLPVFPQAYESIFPPSPPAALLETEPGTEIQMFEWLYLNLYLYSNFFICF